MHTVKKQIQRMQVALAMGVSVALLVTCGIGTEGTNLMMATAASACGVLSGACWLFCE